jgi:DNA mismatch repair protein MutL
VRRKFLKSIATEVGHVSEAFTRLALAIPNLHLTLHHNGKDVYEVPASAGLKDRLRLFFGAEVADKLYAVEAKAVPVWLRGYIADPECERGTAKMQYIFVNGRCIRDRSLLHALQEAYRGLLMTGRYPVAFLFVELPPDQVDVNVHPAKAEVRFRDPEGLQELVLKAVGGRLRAENLTARIRAPALPTTVPGSPFRLSICAPAHTSPWFGRVRPVPDGCRRTGPRAPLARCRAGCRALYGIADSSCRATGGSGQGAAGA